MTKAELLDKLRAAERDPDTASFTQLVVDCMVWGNLSKGCLSSAFGIGKSSIERWCAGTNFPLPSVMKHVYVELHRLVQERS